MTSPIVSGYLACEEALPAASPDDRERVLLAMANLRADMTADELAWLDARESDQNGIGGTS